MKNKQKAKRTTNDVTIATMSFSHLDNNIMIHEETNQVSFFPPSNKSLLLIFYDLNPLILFWLFIFSLH